MVGSSILPVLAPSRRAAVRRGTGGVSHGAAPALSNRVCRLPEYGHGHRARRPQLPGGVLRVVDGDSLILDVRGSQLLGQPGRDRCPEPSQPWGTAAAQRLSAMMTGLFVVVEVEDSGRDREIHGRIVVKGRDAALDLLYDGLAGRPSV